MTPLDKEFLERIIECVGAIEAYVSRTGPEWAADDMAVDAIAKRLEKIGELAKRVTPETLLGMSDVDWRGVKGMREVIAHRYDDVDVEILVSVVRDNLPGLRRTVSRALARDAEA